MRRKPRAAIPARVPATPPTIAPVLDPVEEPGEEVVEGDTLDVGVNKVPVFTRVTTEAARVVGVDYRNIVMTYSIETEKSLTPSVNGVETMEEAA